MNALTVVLPLICLAVGLLAGAYAGRVSGRSDSAVERARLAAAVESERALGVERLRAQQSASEQLESRLAVLSAEALRRTASQFLELAESRLESRMGSGRAEMEQLVTPLQQTLGKVETSIAEAERRGALASAALVKELELVRGASEKLRTETGSLVSALRKPQTRGQWGEMQLRRVVELAGMVAHCDFDVQVSAVTDAGVVRPDLVVRLTGGRTVVVDAKVSLAAFLEAAETASDGVRTDRLAAHARHLRAHVDGLAAKSYWSAFPTGPEFVILFLPGEAFLAPALEHDPALLEHAFAHRVHILTPTTLISALRTMAYEWQQSALTEHAREVSDIGRELAKRLATYAGHVDRLGRALGSAVGHYNASVGSLERNVLGSTRRLAELGVAESPIDAPAAVEEPVRAVSAPALAEAMARGRQVIALPLPAPAGEAEVADG